MNSITLCNINKLFQNRYVFTDEEGIYYLWQIYFSDFGATLEIVAFKKVDNKFVEIETTKVGELLDYLKFRLLNKSASEIIEFFRSLSSLEFSIPKSIIEKFGEKFCRLFLRDADSELLFLDTNAKHWIIDFEKVKNRDSEFLKEPDLFPFFISELGVTLTKDLKLQKSGKSLSIEELGKIYEEYKLSLIPIIKKKDKILRKIEEDLERRFFESLKEIKSKKICDYEIDPKVEVFDTLLGYEPIFTIHYIEEMFKDKSPYSLNFYGLDLKVGRLCWYVLDAFGLESVNAKFYYWSDIEIKNQKFFKI